MMTALTSDVVLQGSAILIALIFASVMSWRSRESGKLQFTTFLLQAMVCEAALIVIGSLLFPGLFASLVNEKAFVVIVAMMTLIYALRDILESFYRPQGESDRKAGDGDQPI